MQKTELIINKKKGNNNIKGQLDEKYRKIMQSVQNALGNCSRQSPASQKLKR
mgnify:CR=1 FL=1